MVRTVSRRGFRCLAGFVCFIGINDWRVLRGTVDFCGGKKKPIKVGKYRLFCFGVNFVIAFAFFFIGATSWSPYLLWTWVFSKIGEKILAKKQILSVKVKAEDPTIGNERLDVNLVCRCNGEKKDIGFTDLGVLDRNGNRRWRFEGCEDYRDCDECRACEKEALRVLWER